MVLILSLIKEIWFIVLKLIIKIIERLILKDLFQPTKHSKNTLKHLKKLNADIFTSHEALLLHYEEGLTRKISNKYYNLSTHMPWLGYRTNFKNSAHVNYLQGIENPIGIKLGHEMNIGYFFETLKYLNPNNNKGKIIVICRFGVNNLHLLKDFIKQKVNMKYNFLWMLDPMHGNNIKTKENIKTRKIEDIIQEIKIFNEILSEYNEYFAGVHLETTPLDVTECLDNENC